MKLKLRLERQIFPPPVRSFSCTFEVANFPHKKKDMSEVNTRSVLARFCDNIREKEKDILEICHVKKWEYVNTVVTRAENGPCCNVSGFRVILRMF